MPGDLVTRFAAALERLRPNGRRIGLAVSGGSDSMAMLVLAHVAIPGEFEVATVDHGLRPEAGEECALVERACAERGIPCALLRVAVGGGNLQEQARQARYSALAKWAGERSLEAIATAHHADDQAETLMMRLNRGSGVAGLAGVRETAYFPRQAPTLPVIRPLLAFRRAELERVIATARVPVARDPSNEDERFDRVRLRKALAAADWLDPIAVAASAANLADADEALQWAARIEWDEQVSAGEGEVRYAPRAPRAVALRVVERAITLVGTSPHGAGVAQLLDQVKSGKSANLAGALASVEDGHWVFRPEPPRRSG